MNAAERARSKSILIIDDDQDDIDLFREALLDVRADVAFQSSKTGQHAMELLSTQLPGLIVIDINMPEMNGWQCLEAIKQNPETRQIPVIMFSTSTIKTDEQKALRLGAIGLYGKPERYEHLKQLVSNLVVNQMS